MNAIAAVQSDSIWLKASGYNVAPLNMNLNARVPELWQALQAGAPAFPDIDRANFFDVELPSGRAYVHVRDSNRTVYLVAYSRLTA
jgi:hypothetical protein